MILLGPIWANHHNKRASARGAHWPSGGCLPDAGSGGVFEDATGPDPFPVAVCEVGFEHQASRWDSALDLGQDSGPRIAGRGEPAKDLVRWDEPE
jgi:hypothetical protein